MTKANKSNRAFLIKPTHWWDRLNPFWWRRKRITEAVLDHMWRSENMEEKMQDAIRDAVLYGEGRMNCRWGEGKIRIFEEKDDGK